jgi:pancreatic triacylglycerol lipase
MTNGTLITWTTTINEFFATNKKATIIVHGWTQNAFKNWIIAMKDAILGVENTNVITVNWSQGASGSYDQSIANSQIVGIDLARLINTYVLNGILTYDGIHIIGHSLGAHVAGFAGQLTVLKVPRITGLDPAGPYFDGMSPIVRWQS